MIEVSISLGTKSWVGLGLNMRVLVSAEEAQVRVAATRIARGFGAPSGTSTSRLGEGPLLPERAERVTW